MNIMAAESPPLIDESTIISGSQDSDEKLFKDTWSKTFVDNFTGTQIFEAIQGTTNGQRPSVSKHYMFPVGH